jgi:small subunit ribosomal protein S16
MVKIILSRIGKKKMPYYRLVVLDKQRDPWGKSLEILGNYDPRSKKFEIKADRLQYWMGKGAQPSATLHNILITQGLLEGKKVRVSNISKKRTDKINAKKTKEDEAKKVATEKANAAEEKPVENAPTEATAEEEKKA